MLIDLVLSGDNAAVIGLAIRHLPAKQRKKAAILGTGGAVGLRVGFTAVATLLLQVPYLSAVGGLILLFITGKLLKDNDNVHLGTAPATKFWSAVGTIIVADLSMAFDNVMGVAGAAHGNISLVILGLGLSVPILIAGSTWLAKLMNRYAIIIYLGAGVLVHTGLKMILHDPGLRLNFLIGGFLARFFPLLPALFLVGWGFLQEAKKRKL